MQGEEGDQGTSSFHSTELEGPILIGGVASATTPELLGPRKPGQGGDAAHDVVAMTKQGTKNHSLIDMKRQLMRPTIMQD